MAVLVFALGGCGASPVAVGAQGPTGGNAFIGGSPAQTQIVIGANGETYVGVWIDAPPAREARRRAPMALSLVVDTSGSMSGEKIAYARQAASSMLETLADGDIVSIYAFSNGAMEIAPPTLVGPGTRPMLMQRVQFLQAAGGTNMYDGLSAGIARIAQAPASHPLRRVVLISDGQANIGPSDPTSLGDLAARGSESALQVTAIGVGLDYDENTLGAVAVRSAGRLYHLGNPAQMAQILEQEVMLLASTVATDAYIEIIPAPGVVILEGVTLGAQVSGNRLRVPLGNVFAQQHREILFRAQVDTSHPGARSLATARFVYAVPGQSGQQRVETAQLGYQVTTDARAAQASVAPRVQAMVATHQAAQAQLQAASALNRGDREGAVVALRQAEQTLRATAAAAPSVPERRRLEREAAQVQTRREAAAGAATPGASRAAALEVQSGAMDAYGY
jgi:Ca-activated chloride channel family protein